MKPLNLAKVFADLANDPSWPRRVEEADPRGTTEFKWCVHNKNDTFHVYRTEQEAREYADSPLTMARLALRLVDEIACNLESDEIAALQAEDINPDHFAKVKERVEEADTEIGWHDE